MEVVVRKSYRHGNLPNAMRAAARVILDEGEPQAVGFRKMARRVGVSQTAAYRHFASKEDLLASVAAEGFRELTTVLEAAMTGPDQLLDLGLAYIEFALRNRGLFRLMFGPILAERAKFPHLNEAATEVFRVLQVAQTVAGRPQLDENDALAAWGLIHGLASLFIGGLVPEERSLSFAKTILMATVAPKTDLLPTGEKE